MNTLYENQTAFWWPNGDTTYLESTTHNLMVENCEYGNGIYMITHNYSGPYAGVNAFDNNTSTFETIDIR